jgi:hypothetical protein
MLADDVSESDVSTFPVVVEPDGAPDVLDDASAEGLAVAADHACVLLESPPDEVAPGGSVVPA